MALATSTIVTIAAVAVTAAAAGTSAYMASEAAADQARDAKAAAKNQAEAERAAGEARARMVRYNAEKAQRSMLSRQAAGGVQVGQGSLLEGMMAYASDAEYDAQMAAYSNQLASSVSDYQAKLFSNQARRIKSTQMISTGLAVGGSLATSYGNYRGRSQAADTRPIAVDTSEILAR